jgi:hypothetical protein
MQVLTCPPKRGNSTATIAGRLANNSLQPWTPAPHRTPALPAGHWDGVAGGARGCGENTRTPAHVCLRHSAGRPHTCPPGRTPGRCGGRCQGVLGLRLTRLAGGKLERDSPARVRENGWNVG